MNTVKLVPSPVTFNQTTLKYNVVSLDVDNGKCDVYYELYSDAGLLIEKGNKPLPITALAVIANGTTDIAALNEVLAAFNIQAAEDQTSVNAINQLGYTNTLMLQGPVSPAPVN